MPPNLSMFTEFGLFRNSNFVTAHEHVANSYIDAYSGALAREARLRSTMGK